MATYTTNYNLEKPAQTDIYNVDVFNANADKIDAGLTDKAEKTMLAPVETTNSASRSYAKGEYFVYNNVLCCATTAIAAGGTIAIGTNCSTAPVGGELKSLRDALTNITENSFSLSVATSNNASWYEQIGRLVILHFYFTPTANVAQWSTFANLPVQAHIYNASTVLRGSLAGSANNKAVPIHATETDVRCTASMDANVLYAGQLVYFSKS